MLTILHRSQLKEFGKELIQVYIILSENAIAKILRAVKAWVTQGQPLWCAGYVKLICISWACQKWEKWLESGPVGVSGQFWSPRRPSQIESPLGFVWFTTWAAVTALQTWRKSIQSQSSLPLPLDNVPSPKNNRQELACRRIDFVFSRISGNRTEREIKNLSANYHWKLQVTWAKFQFYN